VILIPCRPCQGTGRRGHCQPCMDCGGVAVVADVPAAGLWWPGPFEEPTVTDEIDVVCDRERDAQIGVC